MIDRRTLLAAAAAAGALPAVAAAQTQSDEERLRQDWPNLGRYAADNARVLASGRRPTIVFLGDSITEGWSGKRPGFWTAGRINRGISGQTTPQMLCRVMADVVALRPRAMHLMAGTNDVAGNTGRITVEQTCQNLTAICQIARVNGITVLLASVPPADHFPWRPGLETVAPIRETNRWIAAHAAGLGARFVNYTPALATPGGAMKPGLATDGVHPTEAGYDAIASVLEPVLRRSGLA
jgi:lysophospholipase L1-like esterase